MRRLIAILFVFGIKTALAQLSTPTATVVGTGNASTGNVGIGTTMPADPFEIVTSTTRKVGLNTIISGVNNGGVLSLSRRGDGNKVMFLGTSTSDDPVIYGAGGSTEMRFVSGGGTSAGFGFYNNISIATAFGGTRPNPMFKIDGNGNVGIGTTTPLSQKLEVNGGLLVNGAMVTTTNYGLTLSPVMNDAIIRRGTPGNLVLSSSGGTSDIRFNFSYGGGKGGISVFDGGATNYANFSVNSSGNLNIVASGGNVVIGTTSPDAKLAVNGTIHSKEVKVDLIGWPDYVFEKEYNLLSLDEVKAYIDANKHLPEVPSACDVEEHGVNLGEMNALLLKKV